MDSVDVLSIGYACYDLTFSVDHHLGPDEKARATALTGCGGGLAANGAVTAARLGAVTAMAAYLGNDVYGNEHLREFAESGVQTALILRGSAATPLSAILVKPDGRRTLVNYREDLPQIPADAIDLERLHPKAILVDGHQLELAQAALTWANRRGLPSVIDADSLHPGTQALIGQVDCLVASERFARDLSGSDDVEQALSLLNHYAPCAVITLGERGLFWRNREDSRFGAGAGHLPAFPVQAVDTTGAGDAFHGAFAAGLADGLAWPELLRYASAVGALCCTKHGSRIGIPTRTEVAQFLRVCSK